MAPGDDNVTLLYRLIRYLFRGAGGVFYATTECHGLETLPPPGTPTILCFNHGNGLADPLVLIRKTPRMVRFCAKDALWRMPVMKYFVRNSGAVPVYRSKDHGEKAKDLNLAMFEQVISALREGDCLGFAPEGVSRFLPYMEQPFKTGVARIALDAVQQAAAAGDPDFVVWIAPVGLVFTHREKFRSDLCMRYLPPLRVDSKTLTAHGGDVKVAAAAITTALSDALESVTINAPSWETTRLAMTAARLHHPRGTDLTLGQWLTLVRGWVEMLKAGLPTPPGGAPLPPPPTGLEKELNTLRSSLSAYQDALDTRGIKCERVRRAAAAGQALPWYWCVWGLWQRAIALSLLFALATPGLVLWMPLWRFIKQWERALISKGPRWNDSVAEMKMMVCTLAVLFTAIGTLLASVYFRLLYPALLVPYLYLTMRCYEEAVADARSAYSLYKLLLLSPAQMRQLVSLRKDAKVAMDAIVHKLPTGVADHMAMPADEVRPPGALDYYFPWWAARLLMLFARRKKKDWNEVLRLTDAPTMDYVR